MSFMGGPMNIQKLPFVGALLVSSIVSASPLINLSVLGRVAESGNEFFKIVAVLPGDTVEYEVRAQMAPIGTSNTQLTGNGPVTQTINSLMRGTGVQAGDGIQSLKLDIYQD